MEDLSAGAVFLATGGGGDPYVSVSLELLPSTDEPARTLRAFEAHVGRSVDAVVSRN